MKHRFKIRFSSGPLAGKSFSLGPGELLYIGSSSECGVRIEGDPTVSPKHACLHYSPKGKILFKDLGSEQGTLLDGKRVKRTIKIKTGQRITIGKHATFQGSEWDALSPTRITQIAFKKIGDMARRSTNVLHKKLPSRKVQTAGSVNRWTKRVSISGAIVFVLLLAFEFRPKEIRQSAKPLNRSSDPDQGSAAEERQVNPTSHFVWDEIVNISRRFGDVPPSAMDRAFVAEVENWIEKFTKNQAHKQLIQRREKYWDEIVATMRRHNLPSELGYVVWVESAFNPVAESPAGAAGLWQFMPETAREYGLTVNFEAKIDERFDPAKSSEAAAQYFRTLLRMFGSDRYLLALASYNTGQNRVERLKIASAVRRSRKADFWHLHDKLPQETVDYVPKIIAAIIVGRNPDRW